MSADEPIIVLGGAGFVGRATARVLTRSGARVVVVDKRMPDVVAPGVSWVSCDLLTDDPPPLPPGPVVVLLGTSDPRTPRAWSLPVDNAVATARVLPRLANRDVILVSTVEVYGAAEGLLTEQTEPLLPGLDLLDDWCDQARLLARSGCPPWRSAPLGRALAEADPSGRWVYALAKLAQERLVQGVVDPDRLTVLRLANVVGVGQERVVTRLVRRALTGQHLHVTRGVRRSFLPDTTVGTLIASGIGPRTCPGTVNVGAEAVALREVAEDVRRVVAAAVDGAAVDVIEHDAPASDSSGLVSVECLAAWGHRVAPLAAYLPTLVRTLADAQTRVFHDDLPVLVPPRLGRPDLVVERQQQALWTGQVKHGNRWTTRLHQQLTETLQLGDEETVLATASGTAALRLLVAATVGPAAPGEVAVLPSFTFAATAEVLLQLGYQLRYADVDPSTWTVDAARLPDLLTDGRVRVVVAVDTFGQPCDYIGLRRACSEAGVALVADSAAALGSRYDGRPVARLADGHSYSMSFAKVLSSGGAGGAVVLRTEAAERLLGDPAGWARSELMSELHAIVALDQLAVLDRMVSARERVAAVYRSALPDLTGTYGQMSRPGDRHSYVHWVLRTPMRDLVQGHLLRQGVRTKPYFPALHRTSHPVDGGHALPVTEHLHREALALPMSSEIDEAQAEAVAFAVRRALWALQSAPDISTPAVGDEPFSRVSTGL